VFIPLRTNRPPKRRPVVTEALIIANMLVYLVGLVAEFTGVFDREAMIAWGHLGRGDFHLRGLVTYQFMHDPSGIWHLAFNMLFLWVFGTAVEDRLGRASFLCFYLLGGALAGIAHMMIEPSWVIGASGSVAAVTGAFLALFPRSRIQVLVVFFWIGVFSIPALWFIGFFFVVDLLRQVFGMLGGTGHSVAYMAHLAGYVFGFSLAFVLLAAGIVKREEFDVFFLFRQWRRRAAFRAAATSGASGAWESASADTGARLSRETGKAEVLTAEEEALAAARSEITAHLAAHDLAAAAARYRALLETAPDTVFGDAQQLDLANQFQTEGDHETAARAYELLLRNHADTSSVPEVRLILAAIYARRLSRPDRARELIEAIRERLADAGQRTLADQLLAEIGT
jgi:membrane associated rhomboid family serine protease